MKELVQWSTRCVIFALLVLALPAQAAEPTVLPVSEEAVAPESSEEEIRVYQQRPQLRALRVEIAPTVGLSLNDPLTLHWSAGALLNVHLSEDFAIGGSYHRFFHHELPASGELAEEFGVFAERRLRDFQAGGHVIWSPVYGKYTLFQGPILQFRGQLIAGGGVMRTFSPGAGGDLRPTWSVGAGVSMGLAQWLSMGFTITDHMYIEEFVGAGSSFQNDVHIELGISLMLPPSVTYRYPR